MAESWKAVTGHFECNTREKFMLLRKLFKLELAEGESLEKHLREMKDITDQLAVTGEPVKLNYQVAALLASFSRSYGTVVSDLSTNDSAILAFIHSKSLC